MVKVLKWEEYRGRSDIKNHTWFRCANRLLEDEDFFEFTDAEILVWIYILSLCSLKKSDTVFVNFERADRFARRKRKDILSAIEKLKGKQLDTLSVQDTYGSRTDHVRNPCTTLQYITVQDSTGQYTANEKESFAPIAEFKEFDELLKTVSVACQRKWVEVYKDTEWIRSEFDKAEAWLLAKKEKKKNIGLFLTNWLARAEKPKPEVRGAGSLGGLLRV